MIPDGGSSCICPATETRKREERMILDRIYKLITIQMDEDEEDYLDETYENESYQNDPQSSNGDQTIHHPGASVKWNVPGAAGRRTLVTLFCVAAVLALVNVLSMVQHYAALAQTDDYYASTLNIIPARELVFFLSVLVIGLLAFLFVRKVSTVFLIRASLPLYLLILILCIVARAADAYFGYRGWVSISSFSVYMPYLLYLVLFPDAGMVSRYHSYDLSYAARMAFLLVFIPCTAAYFMYYNPAVSMTIFLSFLGLCIKLSVDKRLSRSWILAFLLGIGVFIILFVILYHISDVVPTRLSLILSQGQSDPEGIGWLYIQIARAIRESKWFGSTLYQFEGTSVPAFDTLSAMGLEHTPIVLMLRYGRIVFILFSALPLLLVALLHRLAKRSATSFAYYLANAVAIFFLVREVLALLSVFFAHLSYTAFPLMGNHTSVVIDVLLLGCSWGLCIKQDALSPGVIDREYSTRRLLTRLQEQDHSRMASLFKSLGISGWTPDDDDEEFDEQIEEYRRSFLKSRRLEPDQDEETTAAEETTSPGKPTSESGAAASEPGAVPSEPDTAVSEMDAAEKEALLKELIMLRQRNRELERDKEALDKASISPQELNRKYARQFAEGSCLSPYKGTEPYIFLSYAHKNIDEALSLIRNLQEHHYRVWYDEGIDPGTEWADNIAGHIDGCYLFIALLSKEYLESQNCCDELYYARETARERLLIFLTDLDLPRGIKMRVGRLQAIYKSRYVREEDFYQKLYAAAGIEICREPDDP